MNSIDRSRICKPTCVRAGKPPPARVRAIQYTSRRQVLILYRADQQFVLEPIIPQQGQRHHAYDLVIASQPFRARLPADIKVRNVARRSPAL